MKINVIPCRGKLYDNALSGSTVIVIDVLRCTTSIICAVMNGASKVIPAREAGDAVAFAGRIGAKDCVLGGERGGVRLPDFRLGNSPSEYSAANVRGKTVIISTSNGTGAIHDVRSANTVLIGAMINRSAVAERAAALDGDVLIVCAGTAGAVSADDICAAGSIIDAVCSLRDDCALSDIAYLSRFLYGAWRSGEFDLSKTAHYSRLTQLGFGEDLRFCLQEDITDVVPVYSNGIIS